MKKLLLVVGFIFLFIYVLICLIVSNDKKYSSNIEDKLGQDFKYVNEYDSKYIAYDDKELFLYGEDYKLIFSISLEKVCDNDKKYDIIYRHDDFMYMNSYYEKDDLIYEFYNIYDCKFVDKIVLRG
ncbi:MAG: hypothetical protein IJO57_02070 [Bacilli bacterium]|nr:hypothetical protein [Bacilli bacterium]